MRAALARLDLPHHGVAEDARVTLSIGVSLMHSPPDEDAVGWLERADQQLYRAKQAGRDCVCFDAGCALGDAPQR
jgi:diguanylate cyclase (GGDEF)-like protein